MISHASQDCDGFLQIYVLSRRMCVGRAEEPETQVRRFPRLAKAKQLALSTLRDKRLDCLNFVDGRLTPVLPCGRLFMCLIQIHSYLSTYPYKQASFDRDRATMLIVHG
jgi:hypothetical protein